MLVAILAIIVTLVFVVGIHEGAHALVARIFHVKIKKVSIGFGKPMLRWQNPNGCEWVWGFFPLGGYVQLENTRISPVDAREYPSCFDKKPIWQRLLILLAGCVANFITAWLALILVFSIGLSERLPIIQTIKPNSIAAQLGVLPGDRFTLIGRHETQDWSDVGMQLVILWGKTNIPIVLTRANGEKINRTLNLSDVPLRGLKMSLLEQLGITPDLNVPKQLLKASSLGDAIHRANKALVNKACFFIMVLKKIFTGVIPFSALLGPIGIFSASVASLMQGVSTFIYFIALLSITVGLVNLFPFPGLDGCSIMYALIEKIRGKPISIAMELLLYRLAFIVFCLLLVQLIINDLHRAIS